MIYQNSLPEFFMMWIQSIPQFYNFRLRRLPTCLFPWVCPTKIVYSIFLPLIHLLYVPDPNFGISLML
jgi:hypothetical protein